MNAELNVTTQQPEQKETEIDLLDLLFFLKQKLIFLLIAMLIGACVAGGITHFFITPTYQATAYLYMVSASSGAAINLSDLDIGDSMSADYEQLLTRRPILENIISQVDDVVVGAADEERDDILQLNDVTDLSQYITLSTLADSRVLSISVVTPYPAVSKEIANELADQATTFIPKIMNVKAPTVAEYAVTPTGCYTPSYTRNIEIGMLAGLVCMAAIFTVVYLMDDSIKNEEDMEHYFSVVPLVSIPEGKIDGGSKHHTYRKQK